MTLYWVPCVARRCRTNVSQLRHFSACVTTWGKCGWARDLKLILREKLLCLRCGLSSASVPGPLFDQSGYRVSETGWTAAIGVFVHACAFLMHASFAPWLNVVVKWLSCTVSQELIIISSASSYRKGKQRSSTLCVRVWFGFNIMGRRVPFSTTELHAIVFFHWLQLTSLLVQAHSRPPHIENLKSTPCGQFYFNPEERCPSSLSSTRSRF